MILSVSVMDRAKTKDMIIVYLLKQTSTHDSAFIIGQPVKCVESTLGQSLILNEPLTQTARQFV